MTNRPVLRFLAAFACLQACSPDAPPAPSIAKAIPRAAPGVPAPVQDARRAEDERQAAREFAVLGAEPPMDSLRAFIARHPGTPAARLAEDRLRALSGAAPSAVPAPDYSQVRRLAAEGRFIDALAAITGDGTPAELERAAVENACRAAFNAACAQARERAAKRDFAAAAAAFGRLRPQAVPEVAGTCDLALSRLRAAEAAWTSHLEEAGFAASRAEFVARKVPKLVELVRARRFEEAAALLDPAGAAPGLQDLLADERAALSEAAGFWSAFLRGTAQRRDTTVQVKRRDGTTLSGRLLRVEAEGLRLEGEGGPAEIPFGQIHDDVLVGWTVGVTLPAEEAATYVKAALFFHGEGREDLARLYLATARELKGFVDGPERIFREGLLRQAAVPAKPGAKPR